MSENACIQFANVTCNVDSKEDTRLRGESLRVIKKALSNDKALWQGRRDREEQSDGIVSENACIQFANVTCNVDSKEDTRLRGESLRVIKKALSNDKALWQGRRDSNTQPAVLETAALPLSHSPKKTINIIEYIRS